MKHLLLAVCMFAGAAVAQDLGGDMGGYKKMQIEAGRFKGSFAKGMTIKEMTEGVRINLIPSDAKQPSLPIRSYSMKFDYTEGASQPSRIVMEGNVEVKHSQGIINAERATWDFASGKLVFTGNPLVNSDQFKNLRGDEISINFKTDEIEITKFKVDEADLSQGSGSKGSDDASLLSDAAVKDWPGFITALKKQAAAKEPSPGKQVAGLLDKGVRSALLSMPAEDLAAKKGELVKQLNIVLKSPALYNEAAFKSVALNEEAKALLAKGALEGTDQTRFNRLLLETAFPDFLVK